jgi:steroid delta-isomerase-like uncharacterized protein
MAWHDDYFARWNAHDADAIVAFMTPDAVYEDLALGARHSGRDEIRAFIAGMTTRLSSDYQFAFVAPIAVSVAGYAFEWTMTGTNDGPNGRFTPTGKQFAIRGVSVGRLVDGKIVENRDYWNLLGLLVQLGIMPGPATR